jgi:hypothetical protein
MLILYHISPKKSTLYLDVIRLNTRLFDTGKRSPLFLILGAIGAGLRDCPLLDALDSPGAPGRVLKHLSATHNQTLHTEDGSIDARAATPVGRTVGRFPRLTL